MRLKKDNKKPIHKIERILLYLILAICAFISIFPLYWLFCFSLKTNSEIFGSNIIGIPHKFLWGNYKTAFMNGKIGMYLWNSIFVTGVTIIFTLLGASMGTYAMVRMNWRFRKLSMSIMMIGLMIPIHAALLPVFIMMRRLHLLDTSWSLILPYTAFAMPMAILIFAGFLNSVPKELEEAACIDGCSIYGVFFKIILPLLRPAIATVSIFTFIQAWNELMFAVVFISKDEAKTLTVGIQAMAGQYLTAWGPIGAALVVATVPTLIIYMLLNNQVQKSLIAGAIKG